MIQVTIYFCPFIIGLYIVETKHEQSLKANDVFFSFLYSVVILNTNQ